jgi:hypothetical protein
VPESVIPDRSRLPILAQQIADLTVAIEELDRRIDLARNRASSKIVQAIRPEHNQRVWAMCHALIALKPYPPTPEGLIPFETKKLMSFWPFESMCSAIAGMPVRDDVSLWSFR